MYVRICTYVRYQGRESTEFTISSFYKLFCLKEVGEGLFFFICLTCDIRFKRISRVVEEGGGLDRERGKRRNSDTVLLLPPNRKRNCHHQSVGGGGGEGRGLDFLLPFSGIPAISEGAIGERASLPPPQCDRRTTIHVENRDCGKKTKHMAKSTVHIGLCSILPKWLVVRAGRIFFFFISDELPTGVWTVEDQFD